MPKKKATAFNPIQIKDGWIVRLYKDGRIKSKVAPYEVRHPKKDHSGGKANQKNKDWKRSYYIG